jgi:hypothetical protein
MRIDGAAPNPVRAGANKPSGPIRLKPGVFSLTTRWRRGKAFAFISLMTAQVIWWIPHWTFRKDLIELLLMQVFRNDDHDT